MIREHTEAIKPPRALWVPFELGRPLGVPNDAAFQKRVLVAALTLFKIGEGPVLKDYPEETAVESEGESVWACPINLPRKEPVQHGAAALRAAFKREVVELRAWYDLTVKNQGRTTVGVSGLDMEEIVDFLGAFMEGIPLNPREDLQLAYTLNFAVDDLKAYYYEAAASQPGNRLPSSGDLDNWFWGETTAARVLFAIKDFCLKSDDKMLQFVGMMLLIPVAQSAKQR